MVVEDDDDDGGGCSRVEGLLPVSILTVSATRFDLVGRVCGSWMD